MSENVNTTGPDVKITTVTDTLNDSIFKSLSRIESRMDGVLLLLENVWTHMPKADGVNPDLYYHLRVGNRGAVITEEQIRDAVITTCRRTGVEINILSSDLFVDTVIAILKGHHED
jgi:hypothetical protein|tara:strand:- start:1127 stop:1474 length:348 start_codon:yes stop_codon:yes gene_type:complete